MTIKARLFLTFLAFFAALSSVSAQGTPAPQSGPVAAQPDNAALAAANEQLADLTNQLAHERYQKDIAGIKAELLQSQTSWFEILISAFALMITVATIYFSFRFGKEAVMVAKEGIAAEREQIQQMLNDARAAVADIHQERETARELTKGWALGEVPSDRETVEKVTNLAEDAKNKPRRERTLDEYRALVWDAIIEKDWTTVERRATVMAYLFEDEADDESLAFALFNKAYALGVAGRAAEEIAAYGELISRFGTSDAPAIQERVAMALFNKGISLGTEGRSDGAIAAYDDLINRFETSDASALQERVAKALFNKGVRLGAEGRAVEAIAAYDDLISRFGTSDAPALQVQVAKALFNKACSLARDGQVASCVAVLEQWGAHLGSFDCEKVKNDSDFDKIRRRKLFKDFLARQGCA